MPASVNSVKGINTQTLPVQPVSANRVKGQPFGDIFRAKLQTNTVEFSAHAMERIRQRNVLFSKDDIVKIDRAGNDAEAKGARDSLILVRELALLVSIKNKTVVTAISRQETRDRVFTNIDSAVLIS